MKQFALLTLVIIAGCQPQPIIINERDCHHPPQPPVVIEKPTVVRPLFAPIVIDGCCLEKHCGRYSCPVCRRHSWHQCTPHDHCGCCPVCRSNGWVVGIGIHIRNGNVGINLGNQAPHHHHPNPHHHHPHPHHHK